MLTLYFIKLNLYLSSPYISRVTENQYTIGEAFVNVQFSVSAPAMNTEGTHSVPSVLHGKCTAIGYKVFIFIFFVFPDWRGAEPGSGMLHSQLRTLTCRETSMAKATHR